MKKSSKTVLEMDADEARQFFLKSNQYFNQHLPSYIVFDPLLKRADQILTTKAGGRQELHNVVNDKKIENFHGVNYKILINKDANFSWRPLSIIHPVLYVDLVNEITKEEHWDDLKKRFHLFQNNNTIECVSIPRESLLKSSTDTAQTVLDWWERVEQKSIEYSIQFEYCMFTDISDFYPSIYTHSIAWAIMEKDEAKEKRSTEDHWANGIDKKIQNMQDGQTNGLPQGSSLMDFIAEILLGYCDFLLLNKIKDFNCKIIRYRDDYRIFTSNSKDAEEITKKLSNVLYELGLQLNSSKTKMTNDIISAAIKPGKRYWQFKVGTFRTKCVVNNQINYLFSINAQQHLLAIKEFSTLYPNDGQLKKALNEFLKYHFPLKKYNNTEIITMLSIVSDIMLRNPDTVSVCVAIISELLTQISGISKRETIQRIIKKYSDNINTDYLDIWMQRLELSIKDFSDYSSSFCEMVKNAKGDNKTGIFNSEWLSKDLDDWLCVDTAQIDLLKLPLEPHEYDDFTNQYE